MNPVVRYWGCNEWLENTLHSPFLFENLIFEKWQTFFSWFSYAIVNYRWYSKSVHVRYSDYGHLPLFNSLLFVTKRPVSFRIWIIDNHEICVEICPLLRQSGHLNTGHLHNRTTLCSTVLKCQVMFCNSSYDLNSVFRCLVMVSYLNHGPSNILIIFRSWLE